MEWFKQPIADGTDPLLATLSAEQFRVWFKLRCMAARTGGTVPAKSARVLAVEVAAGDEGLLFDTVAALADLEKVVVQPDGAITFVGLIPRKPSDEPAAIAKRVAKHRGGNAPADEVTPRNALQGVGNALQRVREEERREDQRDHEPQTHAASGGVRADEGDRPRVDPADDEIPFSEPPLARARRGRLAGGPPPALPPVAAPPPPDLSRPATPAPKPPKEPKYSAAFEAWWSLRQWGGSKGKAYAEWKALDLDRDEALRDRVMAATVAQIANKEAVMAAGGFAARFKDACRYLKDRRWEDHLEEIPGAMASAVVPAGTLRFRPNATSTRRRGTSDDAMAEARALMQARGGF